LDKPKLSETDAAILAYCKELLERRRAAELALYGREPNPYGRLDDDRITERGLMRILKLAGVGLEAFSEQERQRLQKDLNQALIDNGWPVPSNITEEYRAELREARALLDSLLKLFRPKDKNNEALPSRACQASRVAEHLMGGGGPSEYVTALLGRSFETDHYIDGIEGLKQFMERAIADTDEITRPKRQRTQNLDPLVDALKKIYRDHFHMEPTKGEAAPFTAFVAAIYDVIGIHASRSTPAAISHRHRRRSKRK